MNIFRVITTVLLISSFLISCRLFSTKQSGYSSSDLQVVELPNGRQTFVLPSGKNAFNKDWLWVNPFIEGYTIVKDSIFYTAIDSTGKELFTVPEKKESKEIFMSYAGEGLFAYVEDFRMGFMNTAGKLVIPLIYGSDGTINPVFSEGVCCLLDSSFSYYSFINKTGKPVFDFRIYGATGGAAVHYYPEFHEGLCVAHENLKYGFIDHSGKWVIPPTYDRADRFGEGLAAVRILGKVIFINKKGEQAIPRSFGAPDEGVDGFHYGPFQNGETDVNIDTSQLHIDPADYFSKSPVTRDYTKDRFAVIDKTGKVLRLKEERY